MSALDAANAHPLAAAKLAEWGVEVEEDLLFLEPADIGELCSLMPKIPSRKFVVLMEKVRAAAASESPGVFPFFLSSASGQKATATSAPHGNASAVHISCSCEHCGEQFSGSRGGGGRDRGAGVACAREGLVHACLTASGASRRRRPVAARPPRATV